MSTTTTVGPYLVRVKTIVYARFAPLFVGEIVRDGVVVEHTAGVANYELARIAAVDEARARLTPDEMHDAGMCSVDDHCGCIREESAPAFVAADAMTPEQVDAHNAEALALGYVATGEEACRNCFNPVGSHAGNAEHLCAQCYAIKHNLPVPCNDCGQPCNEHIECQNENCFLYVKPADVLCERCGEPMTADEVATDSRHCSQCLAAIEDDESETTQAVYAAGTNASRARLAAEKIRTGGHSAWTEQSQPSEYTITTDAPADVVSAALRWADAIA